MPRIAGLTFKPLNMNGRSEPQGDAFHLAFLAGLAPITCVVVAEKSDFALNGATGMQRDGVMKTSAREAKDGFGLMIDTARAEPVLIEKHQRGVVVVVSVQEYERPSMQSGGVNGRKTGIEGGRKVADEASGFIKLNLSGSLTALQKAVRWRT